MSDSKVIVALDFDSGKKALALVDQLKPDMCRLKIGKELFTRTGPQLVKHLVDKGFDIFLDLKFHDIPNTVAKACASAAELGVWMVNVHTQGGPKMMQEARDAIAHYKRRPLLIGVTILTSLSDEDLQAVGLQGSAEQNVVRLAKLAETCGLDGVVCSPMEVLTLRNEVGENFQLVTPGIRPKGSSRDDQSRVMTPKAALMAGSSFIVVGRPITQAKNPLAALQAILTEIQ
ncbi:MAG: orotidine-5'-phosphate decarboxylase [Gammaproteobacteria bacterium]|jgi:orotidine-5'-phosphate decarboxylase